MAPLADSLILGRGMIKPFFLSEPQIIELPLAESNPCIGRKHLALPNKSAPISLVRWWKIAGRIQDAASLG